MLIDSLYKKLINLPTIININDEIFFINELQKANIDDKGNDKGNLTLSYGKLEVKDLHTSFFTDAGEVKAVNGVSFNLEPPPP